MWFLDESSIATGNLMFHHQTIRSASFNIQAEISHFFGKKRSKIADCPFAESSNTILDSVVSRKENST